MTSQRRSKRVAAVIIMLGLAAMGAALLAAPRPRPARRRRPAVRRTLRHRHRRQAVRALRRIPRRRRVLIRRVGLAVVVHQGGTVIRRAPAVVVSSADDLQDVPARDLSGASAYKVVSVAQDGAGVVLMQDGKKTPVRLLGVSPIQTTGDSGTSGNGFVRNLLTGEFVYLDYDETVAQQDETGQDVAYLYRAPDGALLNLEIIRQGYGVVPDYSFEQEKLFRFYQQKAQADGKGIWSSVKAEAPAPAKQQAPTTAPKK